MKIKEERKEYGKKYRQEHKEEIREKKKIYNKENKERLSKPARIYQRQYLKRSYVKIKTNIRRRISCALKSQSASKQHHTIEYLGCSWEFYKDYIEKQFTEGMTWENYGMYGWHIDHIKPLYTFDLCKDEECLRAFHYSNTRPLWCTDNWERQRPK